MSIRPSEAAETAAKFSLRDVFAGSTLGTSAPAFAAPFAPAFAAPFAAPFAQPFAQPPQPPQPPRSLEEQTEIAGEKESVAQKKLEHAKKLAENEPKNPRLSADVETHQKLFDARHRQHMILVAKLAKQLEEELAAQLVDDSG